jgi:hypothetical protein
VNHGLALLWIRAYGTMSGAQRRAPDLLPRGGRNPFLPLFRSAGKGFPAAQWRWHGHPGRESLAESPWHFGPKLPTQQVKLLTNSGKYRLKLEGNIVIISSGLCLYRVDFGLISMSAHSNHKCVMAQRVGGLKTGSHVAIVIANSVLIEFIR